MNIRLQNEIQQALSKAKNPTDEATIQALIEAGTTPEHKEEILDVFRTNNLEKPEALFYQFAEAYTEALHRQEEIAKTLEIKDRLGKQQEIIGEAITKEGVNLAALAKPLEDLASLQEEIGRLQDSTRGRILIPTTKAEVVQEIKNKPDALKTGYTLGADQLSFQTGAFSIIAAPTGHGKTTLLISLLLDMAQQYPNKRHWLFSYEEGRAAITIKALNAYCNHDYSTNNRRTLESYYKGDPSFFGNYNDGGKIGKRLPHFLEKEKKFWSLVENGIINIVAADYQAEELQRTIAEISGPDTGFIGIDYIQLLYRDDRGNYTARAEELKRICLDLKDLAVSKGIAIVSAAQFNRQVQSPIMMDPQYLSDASDIEKAANKVIGLWNGDKQPKLQDKKSEKFMTTRGIKEGTMYLEVLKARDEVSGEWDSYEYNGNRGTIEVHPNPKNQQDDDKKEKPATTGYKSREEWGEK